MKNKKTCHKHMYIIWYYDTLYLVIPSLSDYLLEMSLMAEWLTLKVLVATIDAQWEGMEDVGSARYEPALLSPCPTIRVLSYNN